MFTMGDVARMSVCNEDLLYQLFGKNAELLIDHSWGWEPCTIQAVKAYHPSENSLGSGQVLHCPYSAERARLVLREMAEQLALDLVSKKLMTDQIVLTVGYDIENLTDPARRNRLSWPNSQGSLWPRGSKARPWNRAPERLYLLYKENHGGSYSAL